MRSLINLRIKSKLNFTIHKLNEEITLSVVVKRVELGEVGSGDEGATL